MANPVNERFIQAFEYLRDAGKVTSQRELAQALGFREQLFAGYRDGWRNLQLSHLINLFNKYGVSLNWMISGKGPMMEQDREKQQQQKKEEFDLLKRLEVAEAKNSLLERGREQLLKDLEFYKSLLRDKIK